MLCGKPEKKKGIYNAKQAQCRRGMEVSERDGRESLSGLQSEELKEVGREETSVSLIE